MVKAIQRRKFIKNVGIGAVAAGAGIGLSSGLIGCGQKEKEDIQGLKKQIEECQGKLAADEKETFEWKMATTWPPHFPILGEGADLFAKWVTQLSANRLKIKVYGGGELFPPLDVFDAVSRGDAQMGHGAANYWAGKIPASHFFATLPFGLNAQEMNTWMLSGGGMKLWEEIYAPFNVKPFMAGNTGAQAGGWFNKEIKTIDDFRGLKMRITGLGGKVVARAGGDIIPVVGGEVDASMVNGVIDAAEWAGPYLDLKMNFHKSAKYYYWPGWHKPGTAIEIIIGRKIWDTLPTDLQAVVQAAADRSNLWMLSQFESKNKAALQELINKHNVVVKQFPQAVLKQLKTYSREVVSEVVGDDSVSRKVHAACRKFQKDISEWGKLTEEEYQKFKHL